MDGDRRAGQKVGISPRSAIFLLLSALPVPTIPLLLLSPSTSSPFTSLAVSAKGFVGASRCSHRGKPSWKKSLWTRHARGLRFGRGRSRGCRNGQKRPEIATDHGSQSDTVGCMTHSRNSTAQWGLTIQSAPSTVRVRVAVGCSRHHRPVIRRPGVQHVVFARTRVRLHGCATPPGRHNHLSRAERPAICCESAVRAETRRNQTGGLMAASWVFYQMPTGPSAKLTRNSSPLPRRCT